MIGREDLEETISELMDRGQVVSRDQEVLKLYHGLSEKMQQNIFEIMKLTQEKKDDDSGC